MAPTSSTPQLPFKTPQIPSNRDYKALNRGTLEVRWGVLVYGSILVFTRAQGCVDRTQDGMLPLRVSQQAAWLDHEAQEARRKQSVTSQASGLLIPRSEGYRLQPPLTNLGCC